MILPSVPLACRHPLLIVMVMIAGQAGLQPQAEAELIAYEPFDYGLRSPWPVNASPSGGITGLNGGTGFGAAWVDFTSSTTVPNPFGTGNLGTGIAGAAGTQQALTGFPFGARTAPLGYTDGNGNVLVTAGNQVRTAGQATDGQGSRSVASRSLLTQYGSDGQTLWLSFLGQAWGATTTNGGWSGISLGSSGYFGVPNNVANWGFSAGLDTAVSKATAVFYVAKVEYRAGADQVTVWINPLLDIEPTTGGFTTTTALNPFSYLVLGGRYSTDYDEIRLGTTYAAVAPIVVPEPATAALAIGGLGGLAIASGRRLQRASRVG